MFIRFAWTWSLWNFKSVEDFSAFWTKCRTSHFCKPDAPGAWDLQKSELHSKKCALSSARCQNGLLCERSRRRWWLCLLRGKLSHAELSWVFWCTVGQWAKENDICKASKFPEFRKLFSCIGWGMVENSGYVHLILVASLTSGLSSLTSTSYQNIQMDCSATSKATNPAPAWPSDSWGND